MLDVHSFQVPINYNVAIPFYFDDVWLIEQIRLVDDYDQWLFFILVGLGLLWY